VITAAEAYTSVPASNTTVNNTAKKRFIFTSSLLSL
jgi:hypothetical protein